jgi:uncharacterized protein (TIGR02147 family)
MLQTAKPLFIDLPFPSTLRLTPSDYALRLAEYRSIKSRKDCLLPKSHLVAQLDVFQYEDYKLYLSEQISGKQARGELSHLAQHLGVHRSRLTRFIRGSDHPTHEQAFMIGEYFELSGDALDYLVTLVAVGRSSRSHYRSYLQRKLAQLKHSQGRPAEMLPLSRDLSIGEERVFYSDALYSLVWLCSMNSKRNSTTAIAEDLGLSQARIEQAIAFLVRTGFCRQESHRVVPLARTLELSEKSPSLQSFLTTWRILALEKLAIRDKNDFFQSEPMSIGRKAYSQIRTSIETDLARYKQILASDTSEAVACLNIDLFQMTKQKK